MSVKEIESAITQLPKSELNELAAWLEDYRHQVWDKQIEDDVDAGHILSPVADPKATLGDMLEGITTENLHAEVG